MLSRLLLRLLAAAQAQLARVESRNLRPPALRKYGWGHLVTQKALVELWFSVGQKHRQLGARQASGALAFPLALTICSGVSMGAMASQRQLTRLTKSAAQLKAFS